jgi:uncharacterized protein
MGLQDQLREDLKVALRQRDACRLSIIRVLLAECRNSEKALMHAPLTEGEVLDVLSREAKRRNESIDAFRAGNRLDLVSEQEAALAVIKEYLPAQMGHDEIVSLARDAIAAVGATGMKDKGKVMAHLMPAVKGKADGKEVNEVVTGMLTAM